MYSIVFYCILLYSDAARAINPCGMTVLSRRCQPGNKPLRHDRSIPTLPGPIPGTHPVKPCSIGSKIPGTYLVLSRRCQPQNPGHTPRCFSFYLFGPDCNCLRSLGPSGKRNCDVPVEFPYSFSVTTPITPSVTTDTPAGEHLVHCRAIHATQITLAWPEHIKLQETSAY